MDISAKDAFRLGFLTRCAEEGLTGEALQARIHATTHPEKTAGWGAALGIPAGAAALYGLLSWGGKNTADAARTAVSTTGMLARGAAGLGTAAAGAGLLGGGALGYGAAKMTEPEISDDDIKQQELAETYRIYAERARAKRQARKYRSSVV
jgi:hypothetical protein